MRKYTPDTKLILRRRDGVEVARKRLEIPCGGSRFWRYHEIFSEAEILKISLQTCSVVADVVVHVKDKIYRPNQRFHFANLYLAQRSNFDFLQMGPPRKTLLRVFLQE